MRQEALHKTELVRSPAAESAILPLVLMVVNDFNRHDVDYFYWKSSNRVYRGLTGDGDLDLLVAQEDQHRAQAILLERGLKSFPAVAYRDNPSVSSFLGYDEPSGRIVHVHLHFRLIAGATLLKNYHIPWEAAFAARTVIHPALPIPMLNSIDEALLLIVRACLELRRSDPVVLRNWQTMTRKFALDRADLAARVSRSALKRRATELLGDDLAEIVTEALYCQPARGAGEHQVEGTSWRSSVSTVAGNQPSSRQSGSGSARRWTSFRSISVQGPDAPPSCCCRSN